MSTSADRTTARQVGITQRIADAVINLIRFLGPDPAAIVRKHAKD